MGDSEFDLDNDDATLSEHLISHHGVTDGDLFNDSYSFTVLQLAPHDLDSCEQIWVDRLATVAPFGLLFKRDASVSSLVPNQTTTIQSTSVHVPGLEHILNIWL